MIRVAATSRAGKSSIAKLRVAQRGGYLSWGTVGLAAILALVLGTFIGNTVTSRRYRQREAGVWDILERRLKEQRARPPTSDLATVGGTS